MRVCLVTSLAAWAEPRAPRHAVAAREAFEEAEVLFVDLVAAGQPVVSDPPNVRELPGLMRKRITYPSRARGTLALAWRKVVVSLARIWFDVSGQLTSPVFGARVVGLTAYLRSVQADAYIAHNIETLLPAALAARDTGAKLIFDCMEYYADMGDGQTAAESRAVEKAERRWLPECGLVTASSDALARELENTYGIRRPLALYNTPPILKSLPSTTRSKGLRLYWRNAVIGLGQRGLDDALVALTMLPGDVTLSIQGRLPSDGGEELRQRIAELGLGNRVRILPPYAPEDAVLQAAQHDVGLCLERRGRANHELTISNKLFDYMMAGLAVVVSDCPSLREFVLRCNSGLVFEAGSPESLARQIHQLREQPELFAEFSSNARRFALAEGNLDVDMRRFKDALVDVVERRGVTTKAQLQRSVG
jgi:hypothetical protein